MDTLKFGDRRKVPERRGGYTQGCMLNGHEVIFRVTEFDDETPCEIKVEMDKTGASIGFLLDMFSKSVSLGLQHGVPLETLVDVYTFTRFEPMGPVIGHPRIKYATSIYDLVFRDMAIHYLGREDLAHVDDGDAENFLTSTSEPEETSHPQESNRLRLVSDSTKPPSTE